MRNRIYLTGESDCLAFCNLVNKFEDSVELVNGDGRYRVNAKSVLGCLMASSEWKEIWVECDGEHYFDLREWIADAADDNVSIHE